MRLEDRIAVVTGGASGIGRALARRFRAAGARAVVVADRDADGAIDVAAEIDGVAMTVDVAEEKDVVRLVRETERRFGHIDLFCANAGIASVDGETVTSTANEKWQEMWNVNVMSHVYAVRAALPTMLERGKGYFLHTASAAGVLTHVDCAPYATTKHAVVGFAECVAIVHGDQGIGVSVICPQAVRTPMLTALEGRGVEAVDGVLSPEQVADSVISGLAGKRFLILPHAEVLTYMQRKTADYDRWLKGMRRFRRRFR